MVSMNPYGERLWKTLCFGICSIVLFLALAQQAKAEQTVIFGPNQYAKPKGGSVTHTDSFSTPYPEGSYSLWVQSGPGGLKNASAVSVSLNEVVVLTSVNLQGANPATIPITLQPGTNNLKITLNGQAENSISVKILCDNCSPIRIISPMAGELIEPHYVTVVGDLVAGVGDEVSVMVNGVAALVDGGRFIANHVPFAMPNYQLITAELTDANGNKSEATVMVSDMRPPMQSYITLAADAETGIIPLEVSLMAESAPDFTLAGTSLDCGQTGVEIQQNSLTEYLATFSQPGLYLCTLTGTDPWGGTRQDSIGILVQSREEFDSLLQAKWAGMKTALASSDVETAASFYAESSRDSYRQQFNALSRVLPQIAAEMGPITLIRVDKNSAIYDLRTVRNGTEYSFQLMFVRDGDGIWRIRNY